MSDFVKSNSRGKGAGIEKLGYAFGAMSAIILFGNIKQIYAPIAIALVLGLIATCVLKVRRVSRDYVEDAKETIRVKETYAESDNEEDTDCAVDRSNVGEFKDAHRFNDKSLCNKLWILASQIEPLIVQD